MKQTVQMEAVQKDMKPGVISRDGFLGTDRRNLTDILIDDDARVKRMGLTHRQIAERMRFLRDAGFKDECQCINVGSCLEVMVYSYRGRLVCPFGDTRIVRKTSTTVHNSRLSREITFTDMNIHMIEQHGFYEGKGAAFRLEPKDLAEILEIKPQE